MPQQRSSIVRKAFKTKPDECSMEFTVLPFMSKPCVFSEGGDSGAAIISGWGAVVGMLTGGGGSLMKYPIARILPLLPSSLNGLEEYAFSANIAIHVILTAPFPPHRVQPFSPCSPWFFRTIVST